MLANNQPTMTDTETPTTTETPIDIPPSLSFSDEKLKEMVKRKSDKKKGRTFLGLYIPNELKDKIAVASKKDRRSMSNFSEDILENYFATK